MLWEHEVGGSNPPSPPICNGLALLLLVIASCGDSGTDHSGADVTTLPDTTEGSPDGEAAFVCPSVESYPVFNTQTSADNGLSEVHEFELPEDVLAFLMVVKGQQGTFYTTHLLEDPDGIYILTSHFNCTDK